MQTIVFWIISEIHVSMLQKFKNDTSRNIVYVGNIPLDTSEDYLKTLFNRFGEIESINIRRPENKQTFAFITFDCTESALAAIQGFNKTEINLIFRCYAWNRSLNSSLTLPLNWS